ncbi:ATP-dependent Clp protease adaptor ClpS [Canibacter zhoujuaniae]|uniref:ATP-dependent Clp protease adaptor ClpS n=1 Tax=Canibacter zhoujuaniae TaxID=2708343 RepID=UPI00141F97AF|nr:ATP-dependent Clp protease adaptor ClpS [Canibacter zhoujuaniae]
MSGAAGKQWQVVMHNCPVLVYGYVFSVLLELTEFTRKEITGFVNEAHNFGSCELYTGDKEQAWLLAERLHGYGIIATLQELP